jgi:hypothetical protein
MRRCDDFSPLRPEASTLIGTLMFFGRIAFRLASVRRSGRTMPLLCATATLIAASNCFAASLFSVTPGNRMINELNPNTGELLNSFPTPTLGQSDGSGLAFTGTELFFSKFDHPNIWRLDAKTGAVVSSFVAPSAIPPQAGSGIDALAYGQTSFGPTLFALEWAARRMHLWNPTSGAAFLSYPLPLVNQSPGGFLPKGGSDFNSVDGTLVLSYLSQDISLLRKIDPSTGQLLSTFSPPPVFGPRVSGIGLVAGRLFTSDESALIEERDSVTGSVIRSFASPGGRAVALAGGPVPEPVTERLALLAASLLIIHSARHFRGSAHS